MATHSSILAWRIPVDRGPWRATVHGIAKCQAWLSDQVHTYFHRNVHPFVQLFISRSLMPLDSLFHHYSKNVPWLHCQRKYILLGYWQSPLVTRYLLLRHNSVIYVDIYSLATALIPDRVLIQFHSQKKWTSLSFTPSFNPSWALFNMLRLEIQEERDWRVPACCNHRL